jgi:hypothetical protein
MSKLNSVKPDTTGMVNGLQEMTSFGGKVSFKANLQKQKTQGRPYRHHVEARSRDYTPPRQCVADDHSSKNAPRRREVNKMTKTLAAMFAGRSYEPIIVLGAGR